MKRKKCYLIMGPYRSGTSLVARILQQFGVNAGPLVSLYDATDWNPSGYIQRPDITEFNTQLIKGARGTLTDPGHPVEVFQQTSKAFFSELDLSWMNALDSVLIKDPRFCFTFYTWHQHKILADHELVIIRVSRNLEATARSALAHYDVKHYCGNSMETARRVLASYDNYAAWHVGNSKLPSFHINYDELMADAEKMILQLAQFLNIDDAGMIQAALNATHAGRSVIKNDASIAED